MYVVPFAQAAYEYLASGECTAFFVGVQEQLNWSDCPHTSTH